MHDLSAPSDWVRRWTPLLPAGASVLDVACGRGRHLRWLAQQGHRVLGLDRDPEAVAAASAHSRVLQADLENAPWPLLQDGRPQVFDAVVVTNYLWRPLFPTLLASLTPGGLLIYETFATGNETVGKPSRPDFLLRPGELLQLCADLRVIAYEDGFQTAPERFLQRIIAVQAAGLSTTSAPMRYQL